MEDDWIFLGDGAGGGSDSDSASDDGSDSGFTIVRRGRKGGDQYCSVVVSDDPPAPPLVAAVAVPQPTPPGFSFKVVSYADVFSASAASSSEDGGGRELMPGCNDVDDEATAGEAIIQGAGIDDAAGTGSTDDCTVTCKEEGCESDQVGEHDGTGSSAESPSVAVASAPTVNCPETTAVLHGDAEEVEDEDSESCEEDDDDDTENSSEDEDDTDSSSEDEDEDMFISSDEEEEDTFSSSDEEYTGSFSEEEYTAEIYSEEEEDDDAESSGGEEEEDGSESSSKMDYVESSDEESHDADNTGDEEEEEEDDAECSGEADDVESTGDEDAECTGEEEGDDDLEISGEKEESDAECSGNEDDVESSGDESDDPESCGADSDDDAESYVEEEEEEEKEDADSTYEEEEKEEEEEEEEEESSHVVRVAENGKKDIFAMLFPRATTACDANAEQAAANANGEVKERSESFPSKYDDMDTDSSGSDMEDDICLESDEEEDIVDVLAQNGNQDIFAMLFPKAKACGANMDDYEDESEHGSIDYEEEVEEEDDGSLFDMLLPRNCAVGDDIDSSDGEDEAATATATAACGYNAEPSHGTRRPEFSGRAARGYDDVDTDSDMEDGDGEVAADVNGTSLYGWPRARATTGGGVESQCWGFASKSQTERQALWEDLRRQLAAEAFESSGQQQQQQQQLTYDDVDDTCDLPGTAAPGGGPAGSCDCARTAEAQFTARAVRNTESALAMEEVGRREAAQRELDRALARQAAPAAQALESALQGGPTTKRQATGVTQPAVAKPDVLADISFIICVYVFVFLMVSLLSIGLA